MRHRLNGRQLFGRVGEDGPSMLRRPGTKAFLSRPAIKCRDSPNALQRQTEAVQDVTQRRLEICSGHALFGTDSHHHRPRR